MAPSRRVYDSDFFCGKSSISLEIQTPLDIFRIFSANKYMLKVNNRDPIKSVKYVQS